MPYKQKERTVQRPVGTKVILRIADGTAYCDGNIYSTVHAASNEQSECWIYPKPRFWRGSDTVGDTEEGTHYVCFTTCGKNRVGNRFHARVMMSVKREHTHLRCHFDLRAVERPLSFFQSPHSLFEIRFINIHVTCKLIVV